MSKAPQGMTRKSQATRKANVAPRNGQRSKSPLQRYLATQSKTYGGRLADSYNVGRTRRVG